MRLIPEPPGKILSGSIRLNGQDLLRLSSNQMRQLRGNQIAMIFQEPMTALNPVYTIGDQIGETYQTHENLTQKQALEKATEMLKLVGISAPEKRINEYPINFPVECGSAL